jgi:hypothetical protein
LHEHNKKTSLVQFWETGGAASLAGLASRGILRMRIQKTVTKVILVVSIVILFSPITRSLSIAESRKIGRPAQPHNELVLKGEMNRILRVLENRMEGQNLPVNVKDKLSTLSDEQIRLLDSLAVRMIKSDHTAASDIAFFLLTTLIILS